MLTFQNKTLSISSFIVLSIIFSSAAMAGLFSKESKGEEIWQIRGTGAYLNQSDNIGIANNITPNLTDFLFGGYVAVDTQPEMDWGYTVDVGYIFPSHKYDVQGSFSWLKSDWTSRGDGSFTELMRADPNVFRESFFESNYAEGEITLGTYFKPVKRLMMRFGYGLSYVFIEQKSNDYFVDLDVGNAQEHTENKFWGVGPKFTLDNYFFIKPELSLVGRLGASLLFGQSETIISSAYDTTNGNVYPGDLEQTKVAFGVDAELGLRWSQDIDDDMSWNIEAGYQGVTYLNSLGDGWTFSAGNPDNFTTGYGAQEDYFNYGPYVTIGLDFF
jgi:hypothetical protein